MRFFNEKFSSKIQIGWIDNVQVSRVEISLEKWEISVHLILLVHISRKVGHFSIECNRSSRSTLNRKFTNLYCSC